MQIKFKTLFEHTVLDKSSPLLAQHLSKIAATIMLLRKKSSPDVQQKCTASLLFIGT